MKNTEKMDTLTVGDFFGPTGRRHLLVGLWHSDYDLEFMMSAKNLSIVIDKKIIQRVKRFIPIPQTKDSIIQKETSSNPMTVEELFLLLHFFIDEPWIGKDSISGYEHVNVYRKYLFHVVNPLGNTRSYYLHFHTGWKLHSYEFDAIDNFTNVEFIYLG